MKDQLIYRASILLQQEKYEEAAKILKDLLAQDPNDVQVLAMMSECYLQKQQYKEALQLINTAIGISPQIAALHYRKARTLLQDDKSKQAEEAIQEAINIDPAQSAFYALWAMIQLNRKAFEKALDLANEALELDPSDSLALNIRSTALLKLNRAEESFETIAGALGDDPNNAYTHATYGWNLLEKGDHKKALEHFRESLKLDPNFRLAQQGMAQALKARYWGYRMFLKYSFWMSNLTEKYQWGVIIAFYFGYRALSNFAAENPDLEPYLNPILLILAIFAFSTWVMAPLSNLFLRLNVYGKHLLTKNEIRSSNFVGISALALLIGGIGYGITQFEPWLALAGVGFAMMPIVGTMLTGRRKTLLIAYACIMGILGVGGIYAAFLTGNAFNGAITIFFFGFIAYQWIANIIR
ncbi:MAG: tetratricopeptide repeat protein [Flammeovirgaceae bacterium]